jgi:hypothetical protein
MALNPKIGGFFYRFQAATHNFSTEFRRKFLYAAPQNAPDMIRICAPLNGPQFCPATDIACTLSIR